MTKPERLLTVSSSPHVRARENTRAIMRSADRPGPRPIFAIYFFGCAPAALLSPSRPVAFEALYQKQMKKPVIGTPFCGGDGACCTPLPSGDKRRTGCS